MTKEKIKYMYHDSELGYIVYLNDFNFSVLFKGVLATAELTSFSQKTNIFMGIRKKKFITFF